MTKLRLEMFMPMLVLNSAKARFNISDNLSDNQFSFSSQCQKYDYSNGWPNPDASCDQRGLCRVATDDDQPTGSTTSGGKVETRLRLM